MKTTKVVPKPKVVAAKVVPKKKKRKGIYLKNEDLLVEVIECKKTDIMSDKLAKMLQLLTSHYARSAKFGGYSYNEDMQAYAMLILCKSWKVFNLERSDQPFAYYTQCCQNAFKQYLNREKTQRLVKDELMISNGLNPSYTYTNEHTADQHYIHDEEDHSQAVSDLASQTKTEDD